MDAVPKWYGVTRPLSFDFPSQEELRRTRTLMESLKSLNLFQSPQEVKHRERVVRNLELLFKQWLTETCLAMNVPESVTERVGGRVVPFGSFALGLNTKGADIDLLCVGPGFVQRSDFFSSFVEKLKTHNAIRIIQVIEHAYVPVIKLTFDGIDIDMVYAKLNRNSITYKLDLMDIVHLKGMDVRCMRGLQGFRVTQEIISLVPNVYTFRVVLGTIKHWAKCRNIYSNKMGFLGGVSWGILVARVCQLYPNATAATLVAKFFKVFSMYQWPVTLKNPERHNLNFPVWNLKVNNNDRFHRMPIITPSYPHQNSAFNVTSSTQKIIMKEIKRGNSIIEEMNDCEVAWKKLFECASFFHEYRHYIVVRANASTETQHQVWAGFVESKVRHLVGNLEKNSNISLACPSLQSFPGKDGLNTLWLIGVKLNSNIKDVNFSLNTATFIQGVYAHSGNLWAEGMELSVTYANHNRVKFLLQSEETQEAAQSRCQGKKRERSPDKNKTSAKRLRAESSKEESTAVHGVSQTTSKRPCTPERDPAAKRSKQVSSPGNPIPVVTKIRRITWP